MKKVLCIGSVTADIIVFPLDSAPVPGTMKSVKNITSHVGGCAANAAIDLAKLGTPVILSCRVGNDNLGRFVINTLLQNGIDIGEIVQDPSVNTTTSIVLINSTGERSMLYYPGSTSFFTKNDIPDRYLNESDIVFIAGALLLNSFDGTPCAKFLKKAQKANKFTVMDTAYDIDGIWMPKIEETIQFLDLFMPSYEEAVKLSCETELSKIADTFLKMGAKNVIIKIGSKGAYICEENGTRYILPTYTSVKPVDTTGAGDSFCAGFLSGLSQGWDFEKCGKFANAVGTHCIMKTGASTGIKSIPETIKFMKSNPL